MLMKIVTAILTALLVVALAARAFFYLKMFKPMEEDNTRMTTTNSGARQINNQAQQYKRKRNKERMDETGNRYRKRRTER